MILKNNHFNAFYKDGTWYMSQICKMTKTDMIDDIVHEIAHSVEEPYGISHIW